VDHKHIHRGWWIAAFANKTTSLDQENYDRIGAVLAFRIRMLKRDELLAWTWSYFFVQRFNSDFRRQFDSEPNDIMDSQVA
jgi:hypothetical protein